MNSRESGCPREVLTVPLFMHQARQRTTGQSVDRSSAVHRLLQLRLTDSSLIPSLGSSLISYSDILATVGGTGDMRTSLRRWVFQNLAFPMLPWGLSIVVAPFFLHMEWQFLGINVYAITITLIAFFMGTTIGRVNEIIPGQFDKNEIANRSQLWYLASAFYAVMFTVYDVLGLKNDVHRWFWGRASDLAIIFLGGLTLMRAYSACKALKLDAQS